MNTHITAKRDNFRVLPTRHGFLETQMAKETKAIPIHTISVTGEIEPVLTYSLPLRDYLNVTLTLPRDLTAEECDRIEAFLRALARLSESRPR